jgi:hypothetical protein
MQRHPLWMARMDIGRRPQGAALQGVGCVGDAPSGWGRVPPRFEPCLVGRSLDFALLTQQWHTKGMIDLM